jgi:hypothetical protein
VPPLGEPRLKCLQNTTCVVSAGFRIVVGSGAPVFAKRTCEVIGANTDVSADARLSGDVALSTARMPRRASAS